MMSASTTPAATIGIEWERRKVPRGAIELDEAFKNRHGRLVDVHIKTLAMTIRRGKALTPVTLWKGEGRNSLALLDGEHRLAAYEAVRWQGDIPATVVTCSRRDALLIAAGANTKDALSLTHSERADVAWKLVREPGANFSKVEIARASGISDRTVATMRARWKTMQGTGREPSGRWWQDRTGTTSVEDVEAWVAMTDEERQEKIEVIATNLRKAAGHSPFHDEQMFAEALDKAFGARLKAVIDFLFTVDDVAEWGAAIDEDDEEETPF